MSDSSTKIVTNPLLVLKGTHGTTLSFAQNIVTHQLFQKTMPEEGYTGSGVYFWRYNAYAKNLATCWYDYRVRKGDFKENKGAIIYVNIRVLENEFLDLETPLMKEIFGAFAMKLIENDDDDVKIRKLKGGIYDLFIETLEKKTGLTCKVFQVRIPPPKKCQIYSRTQLFLGDPFCYVVRDQSCIHIEKVEEIKQ
ncbi:MAG TPA: hypothetical protein EYP59_10570 [Thiotrichaceae bacterium]|nr:hypothetical protein [Thiotrichaceae bacterium]